MYSPDIDAFGPQHHVLLTGGTGFFGLALLRHFAALGSAGPRLTVLSRNPAGFAAQHPTLAAQVRWLQGDVLQAHKLPRAQCFSHVLHAAADSTLGPQLSPLQRYDQIVSGTRCMLDFALACGAHRFLLTSSGGAYGRLPAGMLAVPETYHGMPDPMDSQHAYGVAKRTAEHLCALYGQSSGLEVVIARCFAFVGPDLPLNAHFAIGNFIRDALYADTITVNGDGSPLRSYLDQTDLAIWLMLLLHKGEAGAAYNVGSDEAISIAELAHLVRDTVAPGKPVHILGRLIEGQHQRNLYVPDILKIRTTLNAKITLPLRESITLTAQAASACA